MGFFKYPYTDLNELNLDWVIAKIKYIEQAKNIIYDNSGTTLISNNVQDAIDEIYNLITGQGVTSFNGRSGEVVPEAGDYTAAQVTFDNTNTGYTATDVQAAIDEADAKIESVSQSVPVTYVETFNGRSGAVTPDIGDYSGAQVSYDNTLSGLTATDLQAAVDELAAAPGGVTSFNTRTGAVVPAASDYTAQQVDFDDTVAQTGSSNVQGALQYVATRGASAQYTTYDNTQSGLTATNVQDAIDEVANDVLSSGVASFNGRTGAVNPQSGDYDLTELGDVAISSPANDEVLKYDSVSQKWVNGTGGGGGSSTLAGLSDVDTTGVSDGDVLAYDSNTTEWVPRTLPDGYVYTGNVKLTTNAQGLSETYKNMFNDLGNQAVSAFASLANDEILEINYIEINTTREKSMSGQVFDNTSVAFQDSFLFGSWGSSSFRLFLAQASSNASQCHYSSQSINTSNVITIADNTNVTFAYPCSLYFKKYKKI